MDTFEALEKNSIVNRDRPGVVIHMRLQETNLRASLLELFSGFGTRRGFCEGTSGDTRSAGRRCAGGRRTGLYAAQDEELKRENLRARRLTRLFNETTEEEPEYRTELLTELFQSTGEHISIEPPFRCDYGCHIRIGDDFYANYDCIILDVCDVTIGDHVFFGPRVGIYTAAHPIDAEVRERESRVRRTDNDRQQRLDWSEHGHQSGGNSREQCGYRLRLCRNERHTGRRDRRWKSVQGAACDNT